MNGPSGRLPVSRPAGQPPGPSEAKIVLSDND